MGRVIVIPALGDNFAYLFRYEEHKAIAVDPADGPLVLNEIKKHGLELTAILATHHHLDHTAGIKEVKHKTNCQVIKSSQAGVGGGTHDGLSFLPGVKRPFRELYQIPGALASVDQPSRCPCPFKKSHPCDYLPYRLFPASDIRTVSNSKLVDAPGQGDHCRTVPSRGLQPEPLGQMVQRDPRGRQAPVNPMYEPPRDCLRSHPFKEWSLRQSPRGPVCDAASSLSPLVRKITPIKPILDEINLL